MRLAAATSRDKRSFLSPAIIGLGIWIGFPTVAAYQDMASLVSGVEGQRAQAGEDDVLELAPVREGRTRGLVDVGVVAEVARGELAEPPVPGHGGDDDEDLDEDQADD